MAGARERDQGRVAKVNGLLVGVRMKGRLRPADTEEPSVAVKDDSLRVTVDLQQ